MKLKKIMKWSVITMAMMAGICFAPQSGKAAEKLEVKIPTERAIYQRDNNNYANVKVSIEYSGTGEVSAKLYDGDKELGKTAVLTKGEGNTYEGSIANVPGGGWYTLIVNAGSESKTVEKVGVGEVFITGGQSNSCNFGGEKTTAQSDLVSAYNPNTNTWQHCEDSQPSESGFNTGNGGGSAWPSMGDALTQKTGVPVGFVSTGVGSAKIEELRTKHYFAIKNAINDLKPYGYRAFLLHQGEADTDGTNREKYLTSLQQLIAQTREDAGYNLNWCIAQVSYAWSNYNNTKKMESMKETQRAACNDETIFVGPTTDDLQGEYRHTDNLHLSKLGLIEHGKRWADVVYNKMITAYEVSMDTNTKHGQISGEKSTYHAGDIVKVSVKADEGYYLKIGSFTVNGKQEALDGSSFVMHAENAVMTGEFVTIDELVGFLKDELEKAKKIDAAKYEEVSATALKNAILAGEQAIITPAVTGEQVQKCTVDLMTAQTSLVEKSVPDATPTPLPTATPTAAPTEASKQTEAPKQTEEPGVSQPVAGTPAAKTKLPKKGTIIKKGGVKYVITTSSGKVKTVSVLGVANKTKKSITIAKTVSYKGYQYAVTGICKKAFYKMSKLKKIKVLSTKITKVGKQAFKKTNVKLKIQVPKKKLKKYRKLFQGKGLGKKSKYRVIYEKKKTSWSDTVSFSAFGQKEILFAFCRKMIYNDNESLDL